MADFDADKYFKDRFSIAGTTPPPEPTPMDNKKAGLLSAFEAKKLELAKFGEDVAANSEAAFANENSWVNKLGLSPNSLEGRAVNTAASVYSGASRTIGDLATTGLDAYSYANEAGLSEDDVQAYNRYTQGSPTDADVVRLTTPVSGQTNPQGKLKNATPLEMFENAKKSRDLANKVDKTFDQSSAINQTARTKLSEDLGKDFESNWDKVTKASQAIGDANRNTPATDLGKAGVDIVSGIAKLVFNAVEAGVTNPQASTEYIAENLPQLAIGGIRKAGAKLLLASNVGYASDYYRQGITKYQEENDGAYPDADTRQRMAVYAASAAAAEQVVDVGMLKSIASAKEAGKVLKTGIRESVKQVGIAGLEGAVGEALTEGFQTYAEGEASLKPGSAKEIYEGASIGAIAGAGLSGGGKALSEIANRPTTEQVTEAEEEQTKVNFKDAVKANDITGYEEQPSKAIGVLFGHNQLADTTPEVKEANVTKANDIITGLQEQRDAVQEEYDQVSPEAQANAQAKLDQIKQLITQVDPADTARLEKLTQVAEFMEEQLPTFQPNPQAALPLQTKLSKLDRELENSQKLIEQMTLSTTDEVNLDQDQVNSLVSDTSTNPESAEAIINLSMKAPESLSLAQVDSLVSDTSNALTPPQRAYLRAFSEARVAENVLKDMAAVSQEILYGTSKNLGIVQYRERMANAVATGNEKSADRALGLLQAFAQDHASKVKAATQAMKGGLGNQIVKEASGWVSVPYGTKVKGGFTLNSGRLVDNMKIEADALNKAVRELKLIRENKFGVSTTPAVQSNSSAKNDVPQENISTLENVEDGARVGVPPPALKSKATPSSQLVTKDNASVTTLPTNKLEEAKAKYAKQEEAVSKAKADLEQRKEATQQQEVTSVASNSPVAEVATSDATQEQQTNNVLKALDKATPKGETRAYTERNLVADYFTQTPGNENGTQRPLAVVSDFLASLKDKASEFLQSELSERQEGMLSTFVAAAKAFAPVITSNLTKSNKGYEYEDMLQFFLDENGDVESNVKTAITYGAYSWIVENATRPAYNTPEEINAILQRDEAALVSDHERDVLGHVGARQALVVNALGQRIVASLGLKAKPNAPRNLQPQLEVAMGMHAMKLLMDAGIIERTIIDGKTMAQLTKDKDTDANAQYQFLKVVRDANGELNKRAERIVESSKDTQGVLDKLFSVEAGLKEPGFEVIPYTQKTTKNTSQAVPSLTKKYMEKENAQASYIRQDTFNLFDNLDPEVALAIAGFEEMSTQTVHKARRDSLKAKNDGLVREYERIMDYVKGTLMPSKEGIEQPIYFDHTVWKQQRVGILTNMINPQTSKIHRFMMYRPTWETEVAINDEAAMDNFRLRVAEGLGVKTDKQSNVKSLEAYKELVQKPEIKGAVAVLRKSMFAGITLTPNDQQVLLAGVKAGGENMHSLDALIALANYTDKKAKGKPSFKVQMMSEVDGVTNGPMLSHLLMGAANSVKDLFSLLNRGGFFQQGSSDTQYNLWRSAAGHFDLYETTALHMTQSVQAAGLDQKTMDALYTFTGELADKDTGLVKKAGRNIIKTPLTAMVFGSSVKSAVDSMADKFIESIYGVIEEGKVDKQAIIKQLSVLGVTLPIQADLMEHEFTSSQVATLKATFTDTLGKAVATTMENDFAKFIEQRKQFNTTAQMTFKLYDAVYTAMREAKVAELIKTGEIAVNPKTGVPLHDLTTAQEKEVRKALEAMAPIMHTSMSQDSNELNAGLYISKSDRKLSTNPTYKVTSKFGKPFSDNGTKSTSAHGFETINTDPGVGSMVMSIHSTDSAISHAAANLLEVLNVHDAHGAGLGMIQDAARNLNKATWGTTLKYSPAREVTAALVRTITGLNEVLKGNIPASVLQNVATAIVEYAKDNELNPKAALDMLALDSVRMAYEADSMKLEAMSQMTAVDQYAMENGAYLVTDENRFSASSLRSELESDLSSDAQAALSSLSEKLSKAIDAVQAGEVVPDPEQATKPALETPSKNVLGEVGTPSIESNAGLVAMFSDRPVMTGPEVVKALGPLVNTGFETMLLKMISKTTNTGLEVRYVTPETAPDSLLATGADQSRGWYVSKGTKEAIYVLSPEFKHSGLTVETLLHELTHSSLARTITQAQKDGKGDAYDLVKELDALRVMAKLHVTQQKLDNRYDAALNDVQEFVAWGMSNKEFQNNVLSKIAYTSKTKKNKLVTGIKAFIDNIIGLLFQGSTATEQQIAANGMTVLVTNVAGLFSQAVYNKAQNDMVLNQQNNSAKTYSTMDVYNSLSQSNNGATVSIAHDTKLRELLDTIVTKLHGPFGSFKAALMENTTISEQGVFAEAINTGVAPFASKVLATGLRFTEQEAFVLEQVEATIRAGIEANEGQTSVAYRELMKLYGEVQAKVKPENFHAGVWSTATAVEKAEAQKLYDFIFKLDQGPDNRSDYLSRFAALGMAHEGFNTILKNIQTQVKDRSTTGLSFNDRLVKIVESIIDWFGGKLTKTFDGQVADAKLTALVTQLVSIEAKKRRTAIRKESYIEPLANAATGVSKEVKERIEKFGKLPFFKNSKSGIIRATGSVTSALAGDRMDAVLEQISNFRDATMKGKQGPFASMVNEIRGSNAGNVVFHFMLRMSKRIEAIRQDLIVNTGKIVLESFANNGEDLTHNQKQAISAVFLRTDMAALIDTYSLKDIQGFLINKNLLENAITKLEVQLNGTKFNRFYKNAGKALGYKMATGAIRAEHVLMNANNIARLYGTQYVQRISESEAAKYEPIINQLVSLYALSYSKTKNIDLAQEVLSKEFARKDGGNGVEMILKSHRELQNRSKDLLFDGSESLVMKGYTPEMYDPFMEILVANKDDGEELIAKGYVKGDVLPKDNNDPDQEEKHIYSLRDGGLQPHLTGIFSYTGTRSKGKRIHDGNVQNMTVAGAQNNRTMQMLAYRKQQGIQDMFTSTTYDPSAVKETYLAPILNANGDVVNYRYMMQEDTKDSLLDRDNRPDRLLGSLAGSIYDKVSSKEQNKRAVQALYDQYKEEFAEKPASYLKVGPNSSDPELREVYRLLPDSTKKAIKDIWKTEGMMVRVDLLDINFGYRKYSIAESFDKDKDERNLVEQLLVMATEYIWDKKAPLKVRQGEDIWQAVVKATKSNLVVKSWSTLTGNFRSNVSQLLLLGVSPAEIAKHHRVALKGAMAYKKDSAELFKLQNQLETGYVKGDKTAMERRIVVLQDVIARNPVKPLIDAGLMPTIAEDVNPDDDIYSYKSRFVKKTEAFTNALNPQVVSVAKTILMTEDTAIYKGMSFATQISDFLARYTLYQHDISKKNPRSHEEAIQFASDAFINYDIPTHKLMQYSNDMGFVMFSKYYLRIQKMITNLYREKPGNVMALLAAEAYIGAQPTVLDSSMFHRLGNPLDVGAFNYAESLSQLTTVKLITQPFK